MPVVYKFGGGTVKDAASFRRLADIIRKRHDQKLLVVQSALGKSTNTLEILFDRAFSKLPGLEEQLNRFSQFHLDILPLLFENEGSSVQLEIEGWLAELARAALAIPGEDYDREYDLIVSFGEIIATRILHHYLVHCGIGNTWLDARQLLITDGNHRSANIEWELSGKNVQQLLMPALTASGPAVMVTQGFIGGTRQGETTTLGREGSDYSAAALGSLIRAREVIIWKDVPGILNADPKIFPRAVKFDRLSYHETVEMAYYGASVIHPKSVQPLQQFDIPLLVKDFYHPEDSGTLVSSAADLDGRIPSYIVRQNQILLSIIPKDLNLITDKRLEELQKQLQALNISPNMMQNSAVSLSLCTDYDKHKIDRLFELLKASYSVKYNEGLVLLTLRHFREEDVMKLSGEQEVLLEQRSRINYQVLLRSLPEIGPD